MKVKYLLIVSAFAFAGGSVSAQTVNATGSKLDVVALSLLQGNKPQMVTHSVGNSNVYSFIVSAGDTRAVAEDIRRIGGEAIVLNDCNLTARLTVEQLRILVENPAVNRIRAARKMKLNNDVSRQLSKVESVHSGSGLDSPFTGKGVLLGVVDVGFQFNHAAFNRADGKSRIVYLWDKNKEGSSPSQIVSSSHDASSGSAGHGTHVAAIAAGSRMGTNPYYGMAPEADLVLASTTLDNADIYENLNWIKEVAEKRNQPYVINMSLGTNIGSHDGNSEDTEPIKRLVDDGAILTVAAGNENGSKTHTSVTLKKGESAYFVPVQLEVDGQTSGAVVADIWSSIADGQERVKFTPQVYNAETKELITPKFWLGSTIGTAVDAVNGKQYFLAVLSQSEISGKVKVTDTNKAYLFIKAEALDDVTLHGWNMADYSYYAQVDGYGLPGDDENMLSDEATVGKAIVVASYNGRGDWPALVDGKTYHFNGMMSGMLSGFSSHGPGLGEVPQPTVAAPGAPIVSALNSYAPIDGSAGRLDKSSPFISYAVDSNGEAVDYATAKPNNHFFYGVMTGTSMASPAVAGIIALWLQANPELTSEDIRDIIAKTAVRDARTQGNKGDWTADWGYGKIDAYEGLKLALEKGNSSGITPNVSVDTPVTFEKSAGSWRVLFHNAQTQAEVLVADASGRMVMTECLNGVHQGDDFLISLSSLPAGIYILTVRTPGATVSRKVVR